VILDGNMPEMSGPATVSEIRRREAESAESHSAHTNVVALTGLARASDRKALLQAGFDEVITKPVEVPVLCTVLAQFLELEGLDAENVGMGGMVPDSLFPLVQALGGLDEFKAFLATFLADTEQRFVRLTKALEEDNRECLSREAHDLKSNARALHFEQLATLCEEMELHATDMTHEVLRTQISQMLNLMQQVRTQCKDYMEN
jgi:CheY-like chemotaxis protein